MKHELWNYFISMFYTLLLQRFQGPKVKIKITVQLVMTMHDENLSEGIFWLNLLNLAQRCSMVRIRHLNWSLNFSLLVYMHLLLCHPCLLSLLPHCPHVSSIWIILLLACFLLMPKQPFALTLLIEQVLGDFLKTIDWISLLYAR